MNDQRETRIRINVFVSTATKQEIVRLAAREAATESEIIRRAIRNGLKQIDQDTNAAH